ncbi:putative methyltransferase DDB_G0268948 [Cucurbita maxima]|uniref:Methyltransferase DDB_G0268948 n=1 Tax=Cucurbita maxima TaxID=3661 RepID=A0A6J1J3V2_CUCMA|nr:putative methyltransferase DDB_G0268948 [Cucurbita maxima]
MVDKYEKDNLAEKYLEGRPRSYPADWYSKLAALTAGHSLACDFGTGNGQAALGVAEHYEKVIGIDVSKSQLECAMKHERVQYLHLPTSMSEDEMVKSIGTDNTVDLIVSAEAVHWFDLPKFYAVASRLLRKPGGIIAVWGYYYISLNDAFNAAMNRLTEATLPFWDQKVKEYVLNDYRTIPFPFESVGIGSEGKPEHLEMEQEFSFEGMLKYLKSMGPVILAKENGVDVMCEEMVKELRDAWGGGDLVRTVVYKCFMLAGKVRT